MKISLLPISLFSFLMSSGQAPYKQGDVIQNFNAVSILNNPVKASSFNTLKKDITIIDFFGTWCLPCVKALPVLEGIEKKKSAQVAVILVSVEKESQLNKFIAARKNLTFPIIIDEGNTITNLFQPPSYPYTIVVNSSNQIIAITEAVEITDEKITQWLAQKPAEIKSNIPEQKSASEKQIITIVSESKNMVIQLSSEFIYAAKTGNETSAIETKLQGLSFDNLQTALKSDDEKKAFWINIYNGYIQLLLKRDPDKYKSRNKFFKTKQIAIAGKYFSLDEIEHDILRHSKIKWSLGYLNKLFPSKKAKLLRVQQLDYRIHFALNCGAKSCPPIAFYDPASIQTQLDVATRAYLAGEVSYNEAKNKLKLPAIMGWFRRDFKGKKNMLLMVKKYNIVPEERNPSISFKKYDWNLYLNNYKN